MTATVRAAIRAVIARVADITGTTTVRAAVTEAATRAADLPRIRTRKAITVPLPESPVSPRESLLLTI